MVATAADMARGRQHAATEVVAERALCTGMHAGETKNMHGFTIVLHYGHISSSEKKKLLKAMDDAFRILHAGGYHATITTHIDIYLTDVTGVRNIAFVGDAAGGQAITIFLGPRVHHNQRAQKNSGGAVEGGISAGGRARGIADHTYDGTSVWFGNPKQLAMSTAVVIHEMGHVLHEYSSPGIFWDLKVEASAAPYNAATGWPAASLEVSQYATTNAMEFVAETFTGIQLGKTYSPTVMAAYAALGGP